MIVIYQPYIIKIPDTTIASFQIHFEPMNEKTYPLRGAGPEALHGLPRLIPTSTSVIISCRLRLSRSLSNWIRPVWNNNRILEPPNWKRPISSPLLIWWPVTCISSWILLLPVRHLNSRKSWHEGWTYFTVPTSVAPMATKRTSPKLSLSMQIQDLAFSVKILTELCKATGSTW